MQKISFITVLLIVLAISACQKKEKKTEEGWVTFSVDEKDYRFENMQMAIRANPSMWDKKKKIKDIEKGKNNKFEFSIRAGKYKGIKKSENTFSIVWELKNENIDKVIGKKITLDGSGLTPLDLEFNIYLPEWWIKNPDGEKHNCWVKIDSMDDKRISGKFGGEFELNSLETTELGKNAEINNGKFDLPYKKFYKF